AEVAQRAGVTQLDQTPIDKAIATDALTNNIAIGQHTVSVVDHATGLATIAAGGKAAKTHFVQDVSQGGDSIYHADANVHQVFSADVMADTTKVLSNVVAGGRPDDQLAGGRPSAGKTGTNQATKQVNGTSVNINENDSGMFCGFVPQVAFAVWYGH